MTAERFVAVIVTSLPRNKVALKFIFFKRLEGGGAGAQGVVLGDTVKNMDAAVVEQGRLRNRALGGAGANIAAP